ncbi:hypothetical protein K7432_014562 [Basidiobolus ranarum]|uniref:Uncharacterized protein n=1 Tax=Basidiobolus ranarum TaxID=34480 RepID=A0ABR2VPG6_9FUNG
MISSAVPSGRYSNRYGSAMQPEESTDYSQGQISSAQQTEIPLLKQVFTTVTRKHDNLSNANINGQGNSDLEYQSGPSFEVEGSSEKLDQEEVENLGSTRSSTIPPGLYDAPQDPDSVQHKQVMLCPIRISLIKPRQ